MVCMPCQANNIFSYANHLPSSHEPKFTLIFKEFTLIFTKEYTSYRTVRKHPGHLFNLLKKSD